MTTRWCISSSLREKNRKSKQTARVSRLSFLMTMNKPNNLAELRTFLGMAAYCRKFIVNFSDRAACLYDLLKKGKEFVWSEACENNFVYLKEQLKSIDFLIHPNFSKPFILTTEASDKAVGFTLFQEVDGKLLPVLFGGRTLTKAEKNYCTTDKELLGCYVAVKKCEFYLMGHEFALYTDHEPLIHLRTFRNLVRKRFRWIEYLESMNVKIFIYPGRRTFLVILFREI